MIPNNNDNVQIVTIRLSYKLQWPEQRMIVNESAAWGKEGEINISPDNIEVSTVQYSIVILQRKFQEFCFLCKKTLNIQFRS